MNRDKKPLPRFWYFPRNLKAVVVGTGDDHGNGGTAGRFDQYAANSPAGCSVERLDVLPLQLLRLPRDAAVELGRGRPTPTAASRSGFTRRRTAATTPRPRSPSVYSSQLASWKSALPGVPSPVTNRLHCIVFSDWASQPKVELANGIRMDTNYYYWPGSWVQNRPGFMTGSGMPMRFADTDGTMIDIYQAATQMTDESGQSYPFTTDTSARQRPRARPATTARSPPTCTPTQRPRRRQRRRARLGQGPRCADRQWQADAQLDRRPQRLHLQLDQLERQHAELHRRRRRGGQRADRHAAHRGAERHPADRDHPRRHARWPYTTSTVKGLEYATFTASRRQLLRHLRQWQRHRWRSPHRPPRPSRRRSRLTSLTSTATVAWRTNKASTSIVLLGTTPATLLPVKTEATPPGCTSCS